MQLWKKICFCCSSPKHSFSTLQSYTPGILGNMWQLLGEASCAASNRVKENVCRDKKTYHPYWSVRWANVIFCPFPTRLFILLLCSQCAGWTSPCWTRHFAVWVSTLPHSVTTSPDLAWKIFFAYEHWAIVCCGSLCLLKNQDLWCQ